MRIGTLTCGVAGAGNCQISYSVSDAPCDRTRSSYRGTDAGGRDTRGAFDSSHQGFASEVAET